MTDIMRVSEDYDDSEYNLYLILQGFQHGIECITHNKPICYMQCSRALQQWLKLVLWYEKTTETETSVLNS